MTETASDLGEYDGVYPLVLEQAPRVAQNLKPWQTLPHTTTHRAAT